MRAENLRNAGDITSRWLLEVLAALVEEADNEDLGCWLLSSCVVEKVDNDELGGWLLSSCEP